MNVIKKYSIATDSLKLCVLNYGAIITHLEVCDKNGNWVNVVINFEKPEDYLINPKSLGACIGRYAGRIGNGAFQLGDKTYQLDVADGVHLHGGENGWSRKYWELETLNDSGEAPFIRLKYKSVHSEDGYPGDVTTLVTYKITDNCGLVIKHEATSDRDTILNLTNHSYFNLSGKGKSIDDHLLKIDAASFLETDDNLVPTGKILTLKGNEKDFGNLRPIGKTRVDDTYILDKTNENQIEIKAPDTGIKMEVKTNQPATVVFTPESFPAICFETQNYPDAPNHPGFPSALLKAGDLYLNESIFMFSVE